MNNLERAVLELIKENSEGMDDEEREYWVYSDALAASYGCVSGLVYYKETIDFFDKHEEEILDLAREHDHRLDVVELGVLTFKNNMSWFAFEVLAQSVYEWSY